MLIGRTDSLCFCCIVFYFAILQIVVKFVKLFLGLISCNCCNIVFFLYLLYVVFIFPLCKCKYCHPKCCNQINVIKKKLYIVYLLFFCYLVFLSSHTIRDISINLIKTGIGQSKYRN